MRRTWLSIVIIVAGLCAVAPLPATGGPSQVVAPASGPAPATSSTGGRPNGGGAAGAPRLAPTCTPGTPTVIGSGQGSLTVSVPPCADETGVQFYRVYVLETLADAPLKDDDVSVGTPQLTVTGLQPGVLYRFQVAARNVDGIGPRGAKSAFTAPPFTSLGAMVDRQYLDFAGVAVTATQRSTWLANLSSGAKTPVGLVSDAEQFPYWQKQSPVIRLFQAYFLRLPDSSGLAYWTGKFRAGTKLSDISQTFANSSEFKNKYGALTNRQFVEKIYLNVLGRAGDSAGIASWTKKLDDKTKNRGQVMVAFSESSENLRKTQALVWTVNLYTGMLRRLPTKAEVTAASTLPKAELITGLLNQSAYVARVGVIAAPAITTVSLPAGKVGFGYNGGMLAVGGSGAYVWSIASGSAPPGLTLNAVNGSFSGLPTKGGTFTFTAKVTDAGGRSGTRSLSIAIPALAVTTAAVPDGVVGAAYPATPLAAANANGAVTWTVSAGALPAGMSLSTVGVLSGTPTQGGSFGFTAKATDVGGATATKAFTLTIPALAVSTASLPDGAINSAYPSTQLTAANAYGSTTWSVSAGALPNGMALSPAGALSGTPSAAGATNFTAQVTDAGGSTATKALSITVSSFAITTADVPDGYVGVPYTFSLVAAGGTGYSWSITAGTLPGGLTLAPATGVISGTPTTAATSTFTARVDAAGGKTASKQFTVTIAGAADWPQPNHDETQRAWSPTEGAIDASNVAGIGQEWLVQRNLKPTIVGDFVYAAGEVPGRDGTFAPMALELGSGDVAWFGPPLPQNCTSAPVAVTSTAVIVQCDVLLAYSRTGNHDLLWSTADTDPGQTTQSLLIVGTTAITWINSRVIAYRLSDGQRLWQQLIPSGASTVDDVAASGTTVVVAYNDRLRALSATTGAQLWSRAMAAPGEVLIADGWAYTRSGGGVSRFDLATGTPGWSVLAGTDIFQLVGADADTVYAFEARFSEVNGQESAVLRALKASDGTQRWEQQLETRIAAAAITKDLVWILESQIYSWGKYSDLRALRRTDGVERKRVDFDDNVYGTAAFGNGHVVFSQGGSASYRPHVLRSYGFTPPTPSITTKVVPTGRVGVPYSFTMVGEGGTGALAWSKPSGTLPAGLSLSAAGVLSGTPTAAGAVRVQIRVTDANGQKRTRIQYVEVLGSSTDAWSAEGRDGARTGYNPGETTITRDASAQLAFRWKTATPVGTQVYPVFDHQPTVAGTRVFDVDKIGRLAAYDTTGTTANRAPVWTLTGVSGATYLDAPVESGGVLYLFDSNRNLDAVQASTGARLWHVAGGPTQYQRNELLVAGTRIVFRDSNDDLVARNTSDGSASWGGAVVPLDGSTLNGSAVVASDGTRAFVLAKCEVKAITLATGTVAWTVPVKAGGVSDCSVQQRARPIVADGAVFASTLDGSIAIEAATGVVRWRAGARLGYGSGGSAVANGVWVMDVGDYPVSQLMALDLATGEVLWSTTGVGQAEGLSISGDLVVGRGYTSLTGYDLLTGEPIWDGGNPDNTGAHNGAPTIAAGRIFVSTQDGVKAYGLP